MKRIVMAGMTLFVLALVVPPSLPAAAADEAEPAAVKPMRLDRVLFTHSETIRSAGVIKLDQPIHINEGVTLTLIGQEIWRSGRASVEGGGKLVLLTTDDAERLGTATDNLSRAATAGSELRFTLARPSAVALEVFDPQGRSIRRSDLGTMSTGEHRIELGQRSMRTGVYLWRVTSGTESRSGKVFLAR